MKQTPNYNLNKPDYTDVADIKQLNANMDILDRIIKGISDGQFTVEEAKKLFSQKGHNHDDSYLGKTAKASDSELLDGLDSSAFLRNYMGNGALANDLGVSKELRWKHYGQGHTIFDASNGTTPTGRTCNNTNPEVGWSATHPTLMGWNGNQTYGVRVANAGWADTAHNANNVQGFQFRNNNGKLEVLVGGVWLSVGGFMNVNKASGSIINRRSHRYMNEKIPVYSFSGKSGCLKGFNVTFGGYGKVCPIGIYINIDGLEILCAHWEYSSETITQFNVNYLRRLTPGAFPYTITRIVDYTLADTDKPIMNFTTNVNFKNSFSILAHFKPGDNDNTELSTLCNEIIFYT